MGRREPANERSNIFSAIDFKYDDAGQVWWEGNEVNGANGRTQISYRRYPSGDVSQMIYPNGTNVQRFYTARGQLKDVGWGAGATSYVYHPDGKVLSQFRTHNVTTSYEYDGRGMISSLKHRNDAWGHDLAKRDYWRDDRERILAWKRGTHDPGTWRGDDRFKLAFHSSMGKIRVNGNLLQGARA